MAAVKSIHKVNLSERQEAFLISSFDPLKELSVTLLDLCKCEAFSGSATNTELRSQAANVRMNFSVFVDLTKKALSQSEFDGLRFLYFLEENCPDFMFKWKSVDSDETIITIGIIKMYSNDYSCVLRNVFTVLAEDLAVLNKKITVIESDRGSAVKEKCETLQLLAKATAAKESTEKQLYSKFVLVLNEKKRKIKELTQEDSSSNVPNRREISKKKPSENHRNRLHEISDSSSEEVDACLDINIPGPSAKNHDTSLMFLDDDEPKVSISPSKVRNRTVKIVTETKDLSSGVKKTLREICDSESEDDLLNDL